MPNYKVTEYDTVVSTYRIVAINKQDAINKIAKGDLTIRATYRSNGFKKDGKQTRYDVEEVVNGKKKIQVIAEETQNKENTTSTLLRTPTRTRTTEIYKIL